MSFAIVSRNQPANMATLEHLIPKRDRGTMALENLRLAHKLCNECRDTMPARMRAIAHRCAIIVEAFTSHGPIPLQTRAMRHALKFAFVVKGLRRPGDVMRAVPATAPAPFRWPLITLTPSPVETTRKPRDAIYRSV